MSILTTLALMAGSIVAKIRQAEPEPMDVEISRLQAKVNEMDAGLTKLETKIHDLNRERDSWYELMQAWRSRYYELRDAPNGTVLRDPPRATEQRPTPDWAIRQAHQMIQCNNAALAQQAQAMQNAYPLYQQGILGAQGLAAQVENFVCNCVPARHDMLLRG